MPKFYSKTTNGFYDSDINEDMPSDVVDVTDADYAELFSAQALGKTIQADSNGNPKAVNLSLTTKQIHAALLSQAQIALSKSDITIMRCYASSIAVPAAWQTYRSALRSIINGADTTSTTLPATPAYPAGT
jgi:hypothetical protein